MRQFTFIPFLVASVSVIAQTSHELRPWQVAAESTIQAAQPIAHIDVEGKSPVTLLYAPGAPEEGMVITEAPEGEVTWYSRSSIALYNIFDRAYETPEDGCQGKFIDPGDGTVYIWNTISQYSKGGYIVGYYNDAKDEITIPGEQVVVDNIIGDPGEEFREVYSIMAMEVVDDNMGGLTYAITEENTYTLRLEGDKWVSADPDILLGLCRYLNDKWVWPGYGDRDLVYTPIANLGTKMPDNLPLQSWILSTEDLQSFLTVAVDKDNSKIYVQNILDNNAPYCLVGDIHGNRVTFPGGQFMGEGIRRHWATVYGGRHERQYLQEQDLWVVQPVAEMNFECLYDEEAGMLVNINELFAGTNITDNVNDIQLSFYMPDFRIVRREFDWTAPPANPYMVMITPMNAEKTQGYFCFFLPETNDKQQLIDTNYLSWRLFIDGEPYVFYANDYEGLPEDMTEIPYLFSNSTTMIAAQNFRQIYFDIDGFESFGVQAIYREGEHELYSEVVTYYLDPSASVEAFHSENETVSTEYFDLQGQRLSEPVKGIYIVKRILTDGTVRIQKMIEH